VPGNTSTTEDTPKRANSQSLPLLWERWGVELLATGLLLTPGERKCSPPQTGHENDGCAAIAYLPA